MRVGLAETYRTCLPCHLLTPPLCPSPHHQAVVLVLTTSFCLAAVVSFILNHIMPEEAVDAGYNKYYSDMEKRAAMGLDTIKSMAASDGGSRHPFGHEASYPAKGANDGDATPDSDSVKAGQVVVVSDPPAAVEPMKA